MNITIIGAGPVGCFAGYLLAKSDHQVSIYERKSKIGLPIQCTGILTADFDQFNLPINSFLINTSKQMEVNTPQQKTAIKQQDYIICRKKFDRYLADLAQKSGAQIFLNHSFLRKEKQDLIIKDTINNVEKRIQPEIVLAADGPLSPTAKAYGFYHQKRKNYYGIQAVVKNKFCPNTIKTYFGQETCPDFAWITPESENKARVGLITMNNPHQHFNTFMNKNNFSAEEIQAGTIPLYHPQQKLKQDNCYLLGDAAGFVKATTLGGIIPGMQQAQILVDCLNNNKNYAKVIQPLRKKLWLHLQLRRVLNKFSDQDWDNLVKYVQQPKIKTILEEHTRDNPFPLITKTLLKEPRFLGFVRYLF